MPYSIDTCSLGKNGNRSFFTLTSGNNSTVQYQHDNLASIENIIRNYCYPDYNIPPLPETPIDPTPGSGFVVLNFQAGFNESGEPDTDKDFPYLLKKILIDSTSGLFTLQTDDRAYIFRNLADMPPSNPLVFSNPNLGAIVQPDISSVEASYDTTSQTINITLSRREAITNITFNLNNILTGSTPIDFSTALSNFTITGNNRSGPLFTIDPIERETPLIPPLPPYFEVDGVSFSTVEYFSNLSGSAISPDIVENVSSESGRYTFQVDLKNDFTAFDSNPTIGFRVVPGTPYDPGSAGNQPIDILTPTVIPTYNLQEFIQFLLGNPLYTNGSTTLLTDLGLSKFIQYLSNEIHAYIVCGANYLEEINGTDAEICPSDGEGIRKKIENCIFSYNLSIVRGRLIAN